MHAPLYEVERGRGEFIKFNNIEFREEWGPNGNYI
jgi:hypothetical protein